jgi:fatty acid desaturase
LSIFLLPCFLVIGAATQHTYLAFGVAFLTFPLLRLLFGPYRGTHAIAWRESIASALHALPIIFAGVLAVSLVLTAALASDGESVRIDHMLGLGLSMWITMLFALCPAHELIHRRSRMERLAGAILAGACGYPALVFEHPLHHARHADIANAEWPSSNESVWTFSLRRLKRIVKEFASDFASAFLGRQRGQSAQAIVVAVLNTTGMAAWFTISLGLAGLVAYMACATGCALGMQIMTYLQHWGLAEDFADRNSSRPIAWEEDCRFQAWVTLHISFHQAHHVSAALPFYRLGMSASSPRLPAGYIVMMVLCMFPRGWRRIMAPALTHWTQGHGGEISSGYSLTCFHLYRNPGPR